MSGLLLIGVVLLWFVLAISIAVMLASKLKPLWIKPLVAILVMALLIPLPVADEIVGRQQFKILCEQHGRKESDFAIAKGMTLTEKIDSYRPIKGMALETSASMHSFVNRESNIVIVKYIDYRVSGGWLIHALGISETNSPLIFNSSCSVPNGESTQEWLDRYQIKLLFNH